MSVYTPSPPGCTRVCFTSLSPSGTSSLVVHILLTVTAEHIRLNEHVTHLGAMLENPFYPHCPGQRESRGYAWRPTLHPKRTPPVRPSPVLLGAPGHEIPATSLAQWLIVVNEVMICIT